MSSLEDNWERIYKTDRDIDYAKLNSVFVNSYIETDKFISTLSRNSKVLDYGSGFGRNAKCLLEAEMELYITDISKTSMSICKRNLKNCGYDVISIPYDKDRIGISSNKIDGIIAWSVLDHMSFEDTQKTVNEFDRILISGGVLLCSFDTGKPEGNFINQIDGSIEYTSGFKKGTVYRIYPESEIETLLSKFSIQSIGHYDDEMVLFAIKK